MLLKRDLPPYEAHICVDCVYRAEVLDPQEREADFVGCLRSKDIITMSIFSVEGQSNVRYFSATAVNKVLTEVMPLEEDMAQGDFKLKRFYAYRGVKHCEKYETSDMLMARLKKGECIG